MKAGLTIKEFLVELRAQGGSQTISHVSNVANLMYELAKALGYDEEVRMKWYYGGLLHDAGKLFVPAKILNKTTALSDREYKIVMTHVTAGAAVIKQLKIHDDYKKVAINCSNEHHAWRNGQKKNVDAHRPGGYYKDMKYKNISYSAISEEGAACEICDIFEAMTAVRSYSASMPTKVALAKMDKMLRVGQLHPYLYKVFVEKVIGEVYLASEKVA